NDHSVTLNGVLSSTPLLPPGTLRVRCLITATTTPGRPPEPCAPGPCLLTSTPMRQLPPPWIGASHCRSDPVHGGADQVCRFFSNCQKFGTPILSKRKYVNSLRMVPFLH